MDPKTFEGVPASGEVISLTDRRKEDEALQAARAELHARLRTVYDTLLDGVVPVAMGGPWRTWSDAQVIGSIVNVTPEALADTDDPAVAAIGRALIALTDAHFALGGTADSDED